MNVALYYPWIYLTSGAERTLVHLTGRSRHHWTIFTHRFEPEHTFPEFRDRTVVEMGRVPVRRSLGSVFEAAFQIGKTRLPLEDFDALVVVCEGMGDLVTFRNPGIPTICICLTPLRVAFDPDYRLWWGRGKSRFQKGLITAFSAAFRAVDRLAWQRYERVICISEESRRRAARGGLRTHSEMEVVPVGLGFEPDASKSRFGDYFLLPGRIMWTKNVELGIRAFRDFRKKSPYADKYRLVIAGMVDEKSGPYLERLREMVQDEPVEFRLHPSDEELAELYQNAYGVLFTAFNEDWGIVPLEGMAFGKPVIATNRGGPLETVEPGVTGFLEPSEPERFAERMAQLAADPELVRRLGARGPDRAARFGWSRFVERIDQVTENVVADSSRTSAARKASSETVTAGARS